jgi:uncharacterized protein RhaS with RHS repeats
MSRRTANRGLESDVVPEAPGRWSSQDPLGFDAGDSNLYRYVGNNPTNATDASGLQSWSEEDRAHFSDLVMREWALLRQISIAQKQADAGDVQARALIASLQPELNDLTAERAAMLVKFPGIDRMEKDKPLIDRTSENAPAGQDILLIVDSNDPGMTKDNGTKRSWGPKTVLMANGRDFASNSKTYPCVTPYTYDPNKPRKDDPNQKEQGWWAIEQTIKEVENYVRLHGKVKEIRIYDHGNEGRQDVGNAWFDIEFVNEHKDLLARLRNCLQKDGTLKFGGCHVGAGTKGDEFLNAVAAQMPDIHIVASTQYGWYHAIWGKEPWVTYDKSIIKSTEK